MTPLQPKSLIVAGLMSGTSADGIDIAICRVAPPRSGSPKLKLLAHTSHPYNKQTRAAVLAAMDSKRTTTADLSRLHWHLGTIYADALEACLKQTGLRPALIALHGQTIYHQATAAPFLGTRTRTTWQIGEPSVLAERLRVPVASDFRPADLAAGGQGAPLVPMLDYMLFRHATRNRILLNLGGIANLTAIPAGATIDDLLAFDTGPANMVVDFLIHVLTGRNFDRNGALAARGQNLKLILDKELQNAYFKELPPKSCGREEFGEAYSKRLLAACGKISAKPADILSTATSLTSDSILRAYADFVWPHLGQRAPAAKGTDLIVAGGGVNNAHLMRLLTEGFAQCGVDVMTTADTPSALPIEAKEAAAFALLGWLTWHGLPGNVPSATGASRPVVLGKVTHA